MPPNSTVTHKPTGRTVNYGALAADAAKVTLVAKEPEIKTPDQFTLIGKSQARLDTKVKVTGEAIFGIDVRLPDMVYAAVVMCPVPGGTVKSYDADAIRKFRGVIKASCRCRAASPWSPTGSGAPSARPGPCRSSGTPARAPAPTARSSARTTATRLKGPICRTRQVGSAMLPRPLAEGKVVEARYEVPYVAHATMEPLNCTVHLQPDRLDIWMGTQAPEVTTGLAAKTLGMKPDQIYVHNCYLGGGFGRRAVNDELLQALAVAKTLSKPVKLIWTREEDMRHDRYRPQAAIALKGVLGTDGMPTVIQAQTAVGSILKSLKGLLDFPMPPGVEPMAVEGIVNLPSMPCP